MRPIPFLLCVALPLSLLASCATPTPGTPPPVAGAQASWIAPGDAGPIAAHWWASLADPTLDTLIARALSANPDLAEAEARLRSARATVAATRGRELPQVNASGSVTTNAQSANGMIPFGRLPGVTRAYNLFDAGFDASWEIDLWGARSSATRAATARGDVAAAQAAGVRLQVVAEVARSYTELRSAQRRSDNLAAQADALQALVTLQKARLAAGETARDESLSTLQRLASARGMLANVQAEITANAYALAVLTGQPPEALQPLAQISAPIPAVPETTLLGLRSEVLQRRPDLAQAAADLVATRADSDVAHAALFPSLSLTGSLGTQARQAGDFTAPGSSRFGLGPTLHWPIFAGGQLRAQLTGSRALADASAARYRKAVLNALSDSETAANRFVRAREARDDADAATAAVDAAGALAQARFDLGEDARTQALEARLAALSAEQSAIAARASATTAWIALGKALGASE